MIGGLSQEACRGEYAWPSCRCPSCFRNVTGRYLASQYGVERSSSIISGEDAAFNADLSKWQNLGRAKPAWEPDFD